VAGNHHDAIFGIDRDRLMTRGMARCWHDTHSGHDVGYTVHEVPAKICKWLAANQKFLVVRGLCWQRPTRVLPLGRLNDEPRISKERIATGVVVVQMRVY